MKSQSEIKTIFENQLPNIQSEIDPFELEKYGNDSSSYYTANASLVVFPKNNQEVQDIIKLSNQENLKLVPSGGRTGLSGGATATNQEVVLSLDKMNKEIQFNEEEQTIEVQAGMITQILQENVKEKGLYFPIDYAAVGTSQIGGNIATNAGGIHVIHYGMMREWVSGIKVVTGNGELLNLNKGLTKNNTGFDLMNLFIGSEGVLGIITEATIKLTQPPKQPCTFLFSFDNLDSILKVLKWFKSQVVLKAFEFFSDEALKYALDEGGVEFAMESRGSFYAIIEFENLLDTSIATKKEDIENYIINNIFELYLITDGIVALSDEDRIRIWKHRENIPSAINTFQPYKNDISVRIHHIPNFITELNTLLENEYPDLKVVWFGHLGDGNLHLNIPKPTDISKEDFKAKCDSVSIKIYELIQKFEGSISAEHGVGLVKKPYLHYTKSQEEINYMKQIKTIFDPNNILNPGKIF